MGRPWILQSVYLFMSVHVMIVLPTLTKRLLNKKKEKVHLRTGVFDASKNLDYLIVANVPQKIADRKAPSVFVECRLDLTMNVVRNSPYENSAPM